MAGIDDFIEKLPIIGPIYEFAKSIIKGILCMGCCGCCCIILGIILMISAATSTYDEDISAFEDKTKAWNADYTTVATQFASKINQPLTFTTKLGKASANVSHVFTPVALAGPHASDDYARFDSADSTEAKDITKNVGAPSFLGSKGTTYIKSYNFDDIMDDIKVSGGLSSSHGTTGKFTYSTKEITFDILKFYKRSATCSGSITGTSCTGKWTCGTVSDRMPRFKYANKVWCGSLYYPTVYGFVYDVTNDSLKKSSKFGSNTAKLQCVTTSDSDTSTSTDDDCGFYNSSSNDSYYQKDSTLYYPEITILIDAATKNSPWESYSGFGASPGTLLAWGIIFLILGILMVAAFITIVVVLIRCIVPKKKEAKQQAAPLAPVRPGYPTATTSNARIPGQV